LDPDINQAHRSVGDTDINQASQGEGRTPLCTAADLGNFQAVRCLLKLGADINLADANGMTPLMVASMKKHSKFVVWLVKAEVDTQGHVFEGTNITAASLSTHVGASVKQTA
jgi:ankyrin repeat protein